MDFNRTALGIELGSTRIKAVLAAHDGTPLASGSHVWENRFEDGVWTYHLDDVWTGLRACYASLAADVREKYGEELTSIGALGISGMMHGYLAFDADGKLLAPFRTWRNTSTGEASEKLTRLFDFNIPQRWSIAHLYQAMLNGEAHVARVASLNTLAGYVHYMLTGERVLGVGEASGMFPIDGAGRGFDADMIAKFDALAADYPWTLGALLPRVMQAGERAGALTPDGALLLDPSGKLCAGIPLCPPEGDAGTGMVATNGVGALTGNVSAGTSVFAMIVLEKPLSRRAVELEMVTTPTGKPVALVHCNNCTGELDAWVSLIGEAAALVGKPTPKSELYDALYYAALTGDTDCGGLVAYNFLSGEHNVGLEAGRPMLVRTPEARLTLSNLIRAQLFSSLATLKQGMDILFADGVSPRRLTGHGGLFKTPGVGQRVLAAALKTPVDVLDMAGEGGAWGIALLAAFMQSGEPSLDDFLAKVFAAGGGTTVTPDESDVAGYAVFHERWTRGLPAERTAAEVL